ERARVIAEKLPRLFYRALAIGRRVKSQLIPPAASLNPKSNTDAAVLGGGGGSRGGRDAGGGMGTGGRSVVAGEGSTDSTGATGGQGVGIERAAGSSAGAIAAASRLVP
ncbi:unnamed protein product, partial [Scytosiphon promiscuus]